MANKQRINRSILTLIIVSIIISVIIGGFNIMKIMNTARTNLELYRTTLYTQYDKMIKDEVQTIISMIDSIYKEQQAGTLTEAAAKKKAADLVRILRFDKTNYFWIDDYDGVNVVLLGNATEGTNRLDAKDTDGIAYVKLFIENAQNTEGGYANYRFPKPNGTQPLPKRGYTLGFAPWKWSVGTGNWVDDMDKSVIARQNEMNKEVTINIIYTLIGMFLAIVVSVGLALVINRKISKQIAPMAESAQLVADGRLDIPKIKVTTNDDIGHLGTAFNDMTDNLRDLVEKVSQSSGLVASTSQELTDGSEQSAQASNQIAVAIAEISYGTEKQLSVVENTTQIVRQMLEGINQMLTSSKVVSNTSEKAAVSALEGSRAIKKTIAQMNNIEKTVNSSAQVIDSLGERSNEISQIIGTISGIAEQTNLLALNAAIEAARAGEQGRGFAVVADEVRKLAEQSSGAAKQISALIIEIQNDTQKAVTAMNKGTHEVSIGTEVVNTADQAFKEINDLVNTVSTQVHEISAEIQQTANASNKIVEAVSEINEISRTIADQTQTVSAATEEQSASIEEIASASQMLSKMALDLKLSLTKFKV
jgi:methyl-accepting chemotaxis protein